MTALHRIRQFNLSAVCFALSAVGLGHALQIANGFYHPDALIWLTGALALTVAGVAAHRFTSALSGVAATAVIAILAIGIAWQVQQLLTAPPGFYISGRAEMGLFRSMVVLQGALAAIGLVQVPILRRLWFPAFLVTSLGLGVWMIQASPEPSIDVVVVHKEAIEALLHGRDPYRISFENIYKESDKATFYNPAVVSGNRITIGYPYPPPSLLLAVPGHVLFGDYRYAELTLLVAGAGLIGFMRKAASAQLAACLLLTTPRVWFVIEQGWSEPIALFMLALTVFLLARSTTAAGWAGGVLLVTKQYLGFTGLSVLRYLFMRPSQWKGGAIGLVTSACAVTLPFALWDPHAFARNVIWLQTLEPFRVDSLSYLSWAARNDMGAGSFVWAVGVASVAALVSLIATHNSAAGFAASTVLTTFALFAFGSKAFCNYYFFVIGALCCAIAAFPASKQSNSVSG